MKQEKEQQKPRRSMVAWDLIVEEHLRRGGKLEELKIDKTKTRKGRMADKNKPYTR